jgi:hypothetical protein
MAVDMLVVVITHLNLAIHVCHHIHIKKVYAGNLI